MHEQNNLRLIVGIATAGRREVLSNTLQQIAHQQALPDRVVVCPASDEDFDLSVITKLPYPVEVVRGARGLTAQRNLILSKSTESDFIVFFDDDFYPAYDFLAKTIECFQFSPDLVAITGKVIADGTLGPGISHSEALKILAADVSTQSPTLTTVYNAYGCNMAFRMASIVKAKILFDENLPLYSWLEDVDFSRALSANGKIELNDSLRGVHLATKRGRTSGLRFGYSQIANPLYLVNKGTFSRWRALQQICRNVIANLVHARSPEPWVDRRGRLKGNFIAFNDALRGQLHPRRILALD